MNGAERYRCGGGTGGVDAAACFKGFLMNPTILVITTDAADRLMWSRTYCEEPSSDQLELIIFLVSIEVRKVKEDARVTPGACCAIPAESLDGTASVRRRSI